MKRMLRQELEVLLTKWERRVDQIQQEMSHDPILDIVAIDAEFADWIQDKSKSPQKCTQEAVEYLDKLSTKRKVALEKAFKRDVAGLQDELIETNSAITDLRFLLGK